MQWGRLSAFGCCWVVSAGEKGGYVFVILDVFPRAVGGEGRVRRVVLGVSFMVHLLITKVLKAVVKLSHRCHTGRTKCHARFLISLNDTLVVVISRCKFRRVVGRDDIALSPDQITTRIIDNVKFVNTKAVVFRGRVMHKLAATTKV